MPTPPNLLFIMSDDHASHAISAYGSAINQTPQIDRIANGGARFDNCFCTNSICAPSRATILTGLYSHNNGVKTLHDHLDGRQQTYPQLLRAAGYQTAIVGKWHLGHGGVNDPTGFDYWCILPGHGVYDDPNMFEQGVDTHFTGHVSDVITERSLTWLRARDKSRPFALMVHHKAPHRPWIPAERHQHLYDDCDIPTPPTFDDDYSFRSEAAKRAKMRIDRDLNFTDLKADPPPGLSPGEEKHWKYQRYIKDYLRCVAGIEDSVGALLDELDAEGIAADTIVIYTSDQGFFLGDHGWYDKRFMYEESLRMPFVMRYPREIPAGSVVTPIVLNNDFMATFLDYAGLTAPEPTQGRSFRAVARGETPDGWRDALYYRYWMHLADHNVAAHYGVRTERYKLIYYYGRALGTTGSIEEPTPPEWELFDLRNDPMELHSVHDDPAYAPVVKELTERLVELKAAAGDEE
jgi:arylsulfatase A-like enzyme